MDIRKYAKYWLPILVFSIFIIYNCNFISIKAIDSISGLILAIVGVIGLQQLFVTLDDSKVKRELESNDYAFSILNFFREKILNKATVINNNIINKKQTIPRFKNLKKDTNFYNEEMKDLDQTVVDSYIKIVFLDNDVYDDVTDLFNSIEEISAKIIFSKNYKHNALNVIRKAYIEIIENHSVFLYLLTSVYGYSFYHTIELYKKWKPIVGEDVFKNIDISNWRSTLKVNN